MVAVESDIKAAKEIAELDREHDRERRAAAGMQWERIEDALMNHITDSAKVPGYQANGGVFVVSKRAIAFALTFSVAVVAAVFAGLEYLVLA